MAASHSVPELIAAAQATVKPSQDRIAELQQNTHGQSVSADQADAFRAETAAIEAASIDVFSTFESRMQHHFKRGPFSRKLKSLLLGAGQTDLAHRVYQYYLAVNVLKHGKGASYRELIATPNCTFIVMPTEDTAANQLRASDSLIDVNVPGFFDGLTGTILEAYNFLEKQ